MICRKCHTLNEPENRFCSGCGADLARQAQDAKKVKTNRLGCLGCLGLFVLALAGGAAIASVYLRSEGIVYDNAAGDLAMTYVTFYSPVLEQEGFPHVIPGRVPEETKLDAGGVPICLRTKYVAIQLNDEVRIVARTTRLLKQPVGVVPSPDEPAAESAVSPVLSHGVSQEEVVFDLFAGPPPPGIYRTEIFVDGRLKRLVEFTVTSSR